MPAPELQYCLKTVCFIGNNALEILNSQISNFFFFWVVSAWSAMCNLLVPALLGVSEYFRGEEERKAARPRVRKATGPTMSVEGRAFSQQRMQQTCTKDEGDNDPSRA